MWISMRSISGPEMLRDIALDHRRRALAVSQAVVMESAGAGVHGGGEHEAPGR